jgi:hypothetical protein
VLETRRWCCKVSRAGPFIGARAIFYKRIFLVRSYVCG